MTDLKGGALYKLLQEPYIAVEEQLNIIHAVLQNRNAFHTHAKRKARNLRGIVVDESVDIRVNHAAAEQLDPAAGFAIAAGSAVANASATAEDAADLYIGTGFSERKKRRIEARLHTRSEERLHGVVERAFQIAERNVRIDGQAFHLMKNWRVRGVGSVVAVDFAGTYHSHRRLHLLHRPNLHRRGVRAQ